MYRLKRWLIEAVSEHVRPGIVTTIVSGVANSLGSDYERLEYKFDTYITTLREADLRIQKIEAALRLLGKRL